MYGAVARREFACSDLDIRRTAVEELRQDACRSRQRHRIRNQPRLVGPDGRDRLKCRRPQVLQRHAGALVAAADCSGISGDVDFGVEPIGQPLAQRGRVVIAGEGQARRLAPISDRIARRTPAPNAPRLRATAASRAPPLPIPGSKSLVAVSARSKPPAARSNSSHGMSLSGRRCQGGGGPTVRLPTTRARGRRRGSTMSRSAFVVARMSLIRPLHLPSQKAGLKSEYTASA